VLLSWVEQAATELARGGSRAVLESAAFARSLLTTSEIDDRDIAVVESLLYREAQLGGVSFAEAIEVGCARAGELAVAARETLLRADGATPATHEEAGMGRSFVFRRRPVSFDVAELERWLDEGRGRQRLA
jgi:hypothetical protein